MNRLGPLLIVLDGIDNTGKTFTSNLLKDLILMENSRINVHIKHFPSEELCNSEIFSDLFKESSDYIHEKRFIEALLDEERKFIISLHHKDIAIVDRFLISSLLYQGTKSKELENFILNGYSLLKCNMSHYIFMTKMGENLDEVNDARAKFDEMSDKNYLKLKELLYQIQVTKSINHPLLSDLTVFDFNHITKFETPSYYMKTLLTTKMIKTIFNNSMLQEFIKGE